MLPYFFLNFYVKIGAVRKIDRIGRETWVAGSQAMSEETIPLDLPRKILDNSPTNGLFLVVAGLKGRTRRRQCGSEQGNLTKLSARH